MNIKFVIPLILNIALFSCEVQNATKADEEIDNTVFNADLTESVLNFSKTVLKENLKVDVHERVSTWYWDIQMIFEADDFKSDHFSTFTSYSDKERFDEPMDRNYEGIILFAATYKDIASAQHAFEVLKSLTQIRLKDIDGQAGLRVEQVSIFENIRESGGLLTQKDNFVFYLVESCEMPPIGQNWNDYENLFIGFITDENEEIEIIKADCKKGEFTIQKLKASR